MANIESSDGYVICGDTYLALDLQAIPGLHRMAEARLQDLNATSEEVVSEDGQKTKIQYTLQEAAHAVIRDAFSHINAA